MLSISEIKNAFKCKREGRFNSRIVQLINQGKRPILLEAILHYTSFLGTTASLKQRLWHIANDTLVVPVCACGKSRRFVSGGATAGYLVACSKTCESAKQEKQVKTLTTIKNKYGVDNAGIIPGAIEKRRQTNMAKFGTEYPLQNKDILEKTRQSQVEKTGAWGFKNEDRKKKAEAIKMELYGTIHGNPASYAHITTEQRDALANKDLLIDMHHTNKLSATEVADKLGVSRSTVLKAFDKHDIGVRLHHASSLERTLHNWLDEAQIDFVSNDRSLIKPMELDVFIPGLNIAIEANGMWYHSDRYGCPKYKHLDKTNKCANIGIRLIQLYEYEIKHHPDKCKALVRTALGLNTKIGARKCGIVTLTPAQQRQFFDVHHMQGVGVIGAACYGLMDGDDIVAAMSFGKSRYDKKVEWELLRFATKNGITVVGGSSKLFKRFVREHNPASIVSYCDKRLFTGNMYTQLGFTFSHTSAPNYWYFDNKNPIRLYHRTHFQKHKLANKLPVFDPNKTEWENMVANEWNRIWDCGNDVFHWNKEDN